MATEILAPDAVILSTNYSTLNVTDVDDDPDSPDAAYGTWDGSGLTVAGVSFPTPTAIQAGADLQEFKALARKSATGGNDPRFVIDLYENGTLVRTITGELTITDATTPVLASGTWNASELSTSDGSLVECRIRQTFGTGGGPDARAAELGAIKWTVTTSGAITGASSNSFAPTADLNGVGELAPADSGVALPAMNAESPLDTDNDVRYSFPSALGASSDLFALEGLPSDFGTMDSLSFFAQARVIDRVDDNHTLSLRIRNGSTNLAGNTSGPNSQLITTVTAATDTDFGPTAFNYTNPDVGREFWTNAEIVLSQAITQVGGSFDGGHIEVDVVSFSGTYTIADDLLFILSGTLSAIGELSGTSSIQFSNSGDLNGTGELSGSSSNSFSVTGNLTNAAGSSQISGSSDLTFGVGTALLEGTGELSGNASVQISSGIIILNGVGELVGTSLLTTIVAGDLINVTVSTYLPKLNNRINFYSRV